jgi:hypothetical protein
MEIGTSLIGLIILALCILPFVLLGRNTKQRRKKMLDAVINEAQAQNCKITKHEFSRQFVIAADEQSRFLFFAKAIDNEVSTSSIDLKKVKQCHPLSTSRTIKSKDGNYKLIDKLELLFTSKSKDVQLPTITLYNAEQDMALGSENEILQNWAQWINSGPVREN